jgi:hypothetical protein
LLSTDRTFLDRQDDVAAFTQRRVDVFDDQLSASAQSRVDFANVGLIGTDGNDDGIVSYQG